MQIFPKTLYLAGNLWIAALLATPAVAQFGSQTGLSSSPFLPVGQAFIPSLYWDNEGQAQLEWYIEPGYYLYRDRFQYQTDNAEVVEADHPNGVKVFDAFYQKDLEVYYQHLQTELSIPATSQKLYVQFQGCAEAGLCYPPSWIGFEIDTNTHSAGFMGELAMGPPQTTAQEASNPNEADGGLPVTFIIGGLAGILVLLAAILLITRKST